MGRLSDALLSNSAQGYQANQQNVMANLARGGQNGYAQNLTEWVTSGAYIRRNAICILLEAPRGFGLLPGGDAYTSALRALVETQAVSFTGLTASLEVDIFNTNPVGGSGQMFQDPINVTRAQPNVQFRFVDRYGMSVTRFFEAWIQTLIADPDTKYAGIATMSTGTVTDMLPDMYSASMLFIEPDATGATVVKAWIGTNMWPTSSGDIVASRDKTTAMQESILEITFTGVYQYGAGVNAFAQTILDTISLTGANPYEQTAFLTAIDAEVAATTSGYSTSVDATKT